jgi:hypothetical protein
LRSRAEQKATKRSLDIETLSAQEINRMLHELRVHQIELEVQNEELRATREQLETSRAHYFDLNNLAPVGYCILSVDGSQSGVPRDTTLKLHTLLAHQDHYAGHDTR